MNMLVESLSTAQVAEFLADPANAVDPDLLTTAKRAMCDQ